jgi:hypothetical protein
MRKWGILIFVFYALIVMALILPGFVFFSDLPRGRGQFWETMFESYQTWLAWTPLGILLSGQALLLFLSVDTSFKRLRPRAHIFVSCSVVAFFMALLTFVATWTLGYTAKGDKFADTYGTILMASCAALWWLWGSLFFLYLRGSSTAVNRLVSWLLKGSVLQLLIAVPCHIIVRRRHECSAPIVTSFGIATGLAIMLLAFGPSVLFLYKKRLDSYPSRPSM